jgi:hypothetical protein
LGRKVSLKEACDIAQKIMEESESARRELWKKESEISALWEDEQMREEGVSDGRL